MVVSFGAKTLIVWDMATGAQKATFTSDKVRVCLWNLGFKMIALGVS